MTNTQKWYIVKTQNGHCQIVAPDHGQAPDAAEHWGPFATQADAIARRVGLIRAGKCQPQ